MSSPPITVQPNTTIDEVARIMHERNIGSVMVVDENGKLCGIITERDLVYAIASGKIGKELPAWTIMTENPVSVTPNTNIVDAIRKMREVNVRHLPVVDKDGRPVGMLSLRDVIDAAMVFLRVLLAE